MKTVLIATATVLIVTACSWVDLSPAGERVDVMTQDQAAECERLGQTTSQVLDKVGFVDRSPEKLEQELITLARNEAASMGGDAIVAATEIMDGRQRFTVYRCRGERPTDSN